MISVIKNANYSVIRYSGMSENGRYASERFIGSYESIDEAKFIAKKAEKMEKTSIMLDKIRRDPKLSSKINIQSIVLGDVDYKVVPVVIQKLTPTYTNGVSNINHFLNSRNSWEKRIEKKELSSTGFLSFDQFIMLREANNKLTTKRCMNWSSQEINGKEETPDEG